MEKEMILSASSSIEVRFDDLSLCQRSSGSQQTLNNDGNNLVDRISDLPDELLHHILCFLPTKLSFTTTVLSKRWTGLCYSLPVLRFEDETTRYHDTFFRFCRMVNTILLSPRATNQPLKMFGVKCRFDTNQNGPFNVAKWLETTKQRSVEEVYLSLCYQTLKPNIFIFQTLVVLKLERVIVGKNTSCVDLPSLKTLTLEYVYFKNWNDYINFLNACPILEDLNVEYINTLRENVPEEVLKSFTLPKLVRASVDALFYGIDNVEFLRIYTFWFKETSLNVIPMFSNLIHIELVFGYFTYHYWDGVVELLRHSPKLQILYIKKWKKTRSSKEWKCPISVLECVLSHLRSCTILNFDGSENDLRFAKYILQNASLLRDMTIGVAVGSSDGMLLEINQMELCSYPRISPKCKISFDFKYDN